MQKLIKLHSNEEAKALYGNLDQNIRQAEKDHRVKIIARNDPDFERYGTQSPTPKERDRIAEVEHRYGWKITQEQLAWIQIGLRYLRAAYNLRVTRTHSR